MISRRDKLLNYPWEQQRYEQHRQKVRSAKATMDTRTPPHQHVHVQRKWKKLQNEKERKQQIEKENVRLLQKLGDIMRSKRMNNLWLEPRPSFLHREKLFETRPHSSLPKIVSIYGSALDTSKPTSLASTKSKSAPSSKPIIVSRCPTCRGEPERTEISIPEPRIPWPLPRKSMSTRVDSRALAKRCYHCGCIKNTPTIN